ncbi:MAG: DUF1425 domain-containing protein [Opitutales bacterium]
MGGKYTQWREASYALCAAFAGILLLGLSGCSTPVNSSSSGTEGESSFMGHTEDSNTVRGLLVRGQIRGDGTVDVGEISYSGGDARKDLTRINGRFLQDGTYQLEASITNREDIDAKVRYRVLWYGPNGVPLNNAADTPWTKATIAAGATSTARATSANGTPRVFLLVLSLDE